MIYLLIFNSMVIFPSVFCERWPGRLTDGMGFKAGEKFGWWVGWWVGSFLTARMMGWWVLMGWCGKTHGTPDIIHILSIYYPYIIHVLIIWCGFFGQHIVFFGRWWWWFLMFRPTCWILLGWSGIQGFRARCSGELTRPGKHTQFAIEAMAPVEVVMIYPLTAWWIFQ